MSRRTMVLVALVVVLVAAVGVAALWYVLKQKQPRIQYSTENSVYSVLVKESLAFLEAEQYMQSGNFEAARAKYVEALDSARDPVQVSQITYKIAAADELAGDYVNAIKGFKAVVINPGTTNVFRSYAVMKLGAIFNTYGFGANLDAIIAETFKGEPYASFYDKNDIALSYRRIYEYSSSFYPLAISELRIADWHANFIRAQRNASIDELIPHVEIILQKLESAETDVRRIEKDTNELSLLTEIYTRRGEVIAKLASLATRAGEPFATNARDKGVTLEVAEEAYKRALDLRTVLGTDRGQDGMERFLYASFLERYLKGREQDIRAILAPLYERDVYASASIGSFFKSQRGSDTWMNTSLQGMATIDPKFKQLLMRLGWTRSDF